MQRVVTCLCSHRQKRAVNPLYLHGPPGTGKTLLVSVLADEIARRSPQTVIRTVPAADFAILASAQVDSASGEGDSLATIRESGLLIVEDLQYLPARSAALLATLF